MRNQYKKQIYIYIYVLSFISCDKLLEDSPQVSESSVSQRANTLDELNLGQEEANIADYFYDFNSDDEAPQDTIKNQKSENVIDSTKTENIIKK